MPPDTDQITLQTITGPDAGSWVLPADKPATIGRLAECEVCLLNDSVSRRHAMVTHRPDGWFVIHIGNRTHTYLNGVAIERDRPTPMQSGDLLRVGPWTFRVVMGALASRPIPTVDDSASLTQRVEKARVYSGPRSDQRLRLLTSCIAALNDASEEAALAKVALDAALAGSGYSRAAVLRPLNDGAGVEVVTTARARTSDSSQFTFSRTLIKQATADGPAVLTAGASQQVTGSSIADLGIHSAMCVPVMLGGTPAAFLYLDARGNETHVHVDATGFCDAIATAFGMALSALKRAEIEKRQREMAAELNAAREAQHFILPASRAEVGPIRYAMEMRPGVFVAGDLFDVVELDSGRVAVCLGDVAGHGAGSAMLMASTQSYLNAQLRLLGDPAHAINALNSYLCDRSLGGRFVSLWVGVFDRSGLLRYVDAGHGHWVHLREAEAMVPAASGAGIPVGIEAGVQFRNIETTLVPGDRVLAYSDGLLDQRNTKGERYGRDRLLASAVVPADIDTALARMFADLSGWAGMATLDDDATVGLVEFVG